MDAFNLQTNDKYERETLFIGTLSLQAEIDF